MTSAVDICNQSLLGIGAQAQISSISPSDGSTEADACAQLYYPLLRMILRSAHWNFTRAQISMTQVKAAIVNGTASTNPPPTPWQYEYAYPSDCAKARFLLPNPNASNQGGVPLMTGPLYMSPGPLPYPMGYFIVGTDTDTLGNNMTVILANLQQAQLVYTRYIEDPDLWDPIFYQAFVATLAAALVNPLSRNKALFDDQVKIAAGIVQQARITDGNEGTQIQDHIPDWINVRATGTYSSAPPYILGWGPFTVGGYTC